MIVYVRQSFGGLFDDSVFLGSWLSSFFFCESRNQAFFGDSPSFKKNVASFREKNNGNMHQRSFRYPIFAVASFGFLCNCTIALDNSQNEFVSVSTTGYENCLWFQGYLCKVGSP